MEKGLFYGISLTNSRSTSTLDSYKCNVSILRFRYYLYVPLYVPLKAEGTEFLHAGTKDVKETEIHVKLKSLWLASLTTTGVISHSIGRYENCTIDCSFLCNLKN